MKPIRLWQLSVVTTPEAEDAVSDQLQNLFARAPSSYADVETGRTTVSVYLEKRPAWPALRMRLVGGIDRARRCGLRIGAGKISLRRLPAEDWAEAWKRHFKPIEIGSALLIKPGWSKRRARKGQAVIVLDPGLSFGTGQHPTTRFCLRQLAERRRRRDAQSLLDIGTGSGILAIAAARLGYSPVEAFDADPAAVRAARANARRNRVSTRLQIRQADLTRLRARAEREYDVICANLIATLLISERRRIACRVKPGGALVVAGVLGSEFRSVRRAYESLGFRLTASQAEGPWESGCFEWRRHPGWRASQTGWRKL